MNRTKISWADVTWNPVTGCRADCEYCYARSIARRFGNGGASAGMLHDINMVGDPPAIDTAAYKGSQYPYGFEPTLHRYRLGEPAAQRKPKTIFVCSMADLFGEWVPDSWLDAVFAACDAAPWHRYIFLTKRFERFRRLSLEHRLPERDNFLYGFTATTKREIKQACIVPRADFVCIEPLRDDSIQDLGAWLVDLNLKPIWKWVILGIETGGRKGRFVPGKQIIKNMTFACRSAGIPLYMKEGLESIAGSPLLQQKPSFFSKEET